MKMTLLKVVLGIGIFSCGEMLYAVPATFISPDQISTTPFTITAPGLYVLTDDVAYSTAGGTAITIGSSGVTLNLNSKTIVNSGAGQEIGIALSGTFTNITIKNGTLRIFDGVGINITAGSSDIKVQDVGIIGLNITTGTALNFLGTSGSVLRTSAVTVENVLISNCLRGLEATATDALLLINSTISKNGPRGVTTTDCNVWDIYDSKFSFNSSSTEGIGIIGVDSSCWSITNCDFSYNTGGTGIGRGMAFQLGALNSSGGHEIRECTFCRNGSTSGTGAGLDLDTTNSCVVIKCIGNGNFSTTSTAIGLSITGSGVLIDTCIADANQTFGGSGDADGIFITGSGHRIVDTQCISNSSFGGNGLGLNITGTGHMVDGCKFDANASLSASVGRGMLMQSTAAKCLVKDCTALANSHRGFETLAPSGSNLFIGNISFSHGTSGANNFVGAIPFLSVAAAGPYPLAGFFDNRQLANISFT